MALDSVSGPTTTAAHFDGLTYKSASNTAGYTAKGQTITYTKATKETDLFTLTGVKNTSGVTVSNKGVVTLKAANLNGKNVTVDNKNYTLALDSVSGPTTTAAHFDGLTYKSASNTAGYTAKGQTITYTKATKETDLFTLTGVKNTSGVTVSNKGVVTLKAANLNKADVTVDNNDYTLKLGSDVSAPQKEKSGSWSTLKNNKSTYYAAGTTAGYELSDNKITYSAAVKGNQLVTASGIKSTDGITVTNKAITIDTDAVKVDEDTAVTINVTNIQNKAYTISGAEKITGFNAKNHTLAGTPTDAKVEGKNLVLPLTDGDVTINGAATSTIKVAGDSITYSATADLLTAGDSATITSNYDTSKEFTVAEDIKEVIGTNATGGLTVNGEEVSSVIIVGSANADQLTGSSGNDSINGAKGNDILNGGAGKDTLNGGAGNDLLNGGAGNDNLSGGIGKDTLDGGAGNDLLYGREGNDSLSGGAGKDTLHGGIGDDTLTGGKGNDLFIYNDGNDVITDYTVGEDVIRLTDSYTGVSFDDDDVILSFDDGELVIKDARKKEVTFSDGTVQIFKEEPIINGKVAILPAGFDEDYTVPEGVKHVNASATSADINITGDGSANSLVGGSGSNEITGNAGKDTLVGGAGDDVLNGNAGNDVMNGNAGDDMLYGGAGNDILRGNEGKDYLLGEAGNDTLEGGNGADTLDGGAGNDSLVGGNGKDTFIYSGGNDTIKTFNVKEDSLENTFSIPYAGELTSSDDGLVLQFNERNSLTIEKLTGGSSFDIAAGDAVYTYTKNYVTDNDTAVTLYSDATNYKSTDNIISIDGSLATSPISITGNSNDNIITMGSAGGSVNAAAGDDTVYAGAGSDTIILSKGDDVINGFDVENDRLGLGSFSLNDISDVDYTTRATTLTIGDNTVELNGLAKNAVIGFVNSKGKYAGGVTTSGMIDAKGNYELNSSAKGTYAGSDEIKSINASATTNKVTLVGGASGGTLTGGEGKDTFEYTGGNLTINNYAAGEAVNTGDYSAIKDVSVKGQNVTLTMTDGITDGKINLANTKGEVINLNGKSMLFTESGRIYNKITNPTTVMLTSSSGNYDASTDENAAKIKTIDATLNEKTISIKGNDNNNVIIAGSASTTLNSGNGSKNTLTGGEGKNTFVHNGGNTTIEDYSLESGDVISVTGLTKRNLNENISKVSLNSMSNSGTLKVELADGSKVEINSDEYSKTALNNGDKATVNFSGVGQVVMDSDAIYDTKSATLLSGFSGKYDASTKFDTTGVTVDASNVAGKKSSINLIGTSGKDTLKSGGGTKGSATLQGGAGNDKLTGAVGVKDTFYYAAGDGKDVIADFTSKEDIVQIATKNALSSVKETKGSLTFNMNDKGSIKVNDLSANNVFIKNGNKLYWFEDIDGDKKGEWVTGTDSTTKSALRTIMKSEDYAIVDVSYSAWSTLSQSVKFGAKSAYGTSKTVSDFSSYRKR